MKKFLEDHKFKPEGRGGKYAGPTMRLFLKELCFDLGERLQAADRRLAKQVVDFCQSLWSLYKMSVSKTLDPDYKKYIDDYRVKFMILYRRIGLMFTLKEHVVISHVEEYFDTKQETLRWSSEEYLETTHSALRQMEERFRLRTKGRKRGTRVHQERLLRSSYLYNFPRLGFIPHRFDDDVVAELAPLPHKPHHVDHSYCLQVFLKFCLH